jgi:Putative transposase/Phage integrase, N-terminal SAM-like domain
MNSKNSKVGNRVKMSSSERKQSKILKQSSSPLRERYLEDLRLHKFSERTIGSYLEAVLRMVLHTNLSPVQISNEELREYFLYLEKRQDEMLPVNYYMVTFTLPHEFNYLCKVNPKEMFKTFFKSSSESLKQVAGYKNILNGNIGMMGTLQTWARDGSYHVHIHYIVPGIALEDNKENLRFPKNPDYLMPMQILQKVFKAKFIDELRNLEFYDSIDSKAWIYDWIVHCQSVGNGQAAIKISECLYAKNIHQWQTN